MCSELRRNAERSAETTGPSHVCFMNHGIHEKVTDCKYMSADVVLDGGFQGFTTDPFQPTYSGGTAVGGAPANVMYFTNTKYLHWRPHSERNMVPLDPDRFSINQDAMVRLVGWAGNFTTSCSFLQGVLSA